MIGAAVLAAAAVAAAPYPTQDILAAFGAVCFAQVPQSSDAASKFDFWATTAVQRGWVEIESEPPGGGSYQENAGVRTYRWAQAVDYDLFTTLAPLGNERLRRALYGKVVAGRPVYLSIVAIAQTNPTLDECRLRDPLGDGVLKLPIDRSAVEAWRGHPVKKTGGWYRSTEYFWPDGRYRRAMRVHFGFIGKPLGVYGGKYDPYTFYGMTLVRSEREEIIIT